MSTRAQATVLEPRVLPTQAAPTQAAVLPAMAPYTVLPWRIAERVPALLKSRTLCDVVRKFERGMLLLSGSESLFIGTDETSAGPFNIQVSPAHFFLLKGFEGRYRSNKSGCLYLENIAIVTTNAHIYQTQIPTLDSHANLLLEELLGTYLQCCKQPTGLGYSSLELIETSGLLPFLPLQLTAYEGWSEEAFQGTPLSATLPSGTSAAATLPSATLSKFIHFFVGRGQGATPSGDDFLVGMMAALPHTAFRVEVLKQALAHGATGLISQAYYQAAGSGHFDESLVLLFEAAKSADTAHINRLLERIAQQGHSSGIDLLTGMLFGLRCKISTHQSA